MTRFHNFTLDDLLNLDVDPNDRQNESPTAGEFMEFMRKHPRFTAHGYIIPPPRPDSRITIEGLELKGEPTLDEVIDFIQLCHGADELLISKDGLYSWWD